MRRLFAAALLLTSAASSARTTTVVTIETVLGSFDIEMLEQQAPATVANFLNYVRPRVVQGVMQPGRYDGTFIHRSVPGFIVQGGGFRYDVATNSAPGIATDAPVVNEFGISNARGTVAMAKLGGNPNSATSQWFVNLADNGANLDAQNGGFTVFGRVLGSGMAVVDAIAARPRVNFGGAFTDTPTIDFTGTINESIFVRVIRATATTIVDTDDDGSPDDFETANGLDPLVDQRRSLDLDGDGMTAVLTDGVLLLRHLYGFGEGALASGAIAAGATRSEAEVIAHLQAIGALLDSDRSGQAGALTDGVQILRRLAGLSGAAIDSGAVDAACQRCAGDSIGAFIDAIR